ncbi:MAG: hypothetical protein R2681_06010 [Pyrinomonadaceae bacterium]
MNCCGFKKSVIPFFAAFLIGILIAGFFVSFGSSGINTGSNVDRDEATQLKLENLRLKRENRRLKRKRHMHSDVYHLVPPPPPPAPVAPPPPKAPAAPLPPEAPVATQ